MDMDRIGAALGRLIRRETAHFDYFALYGCSVVTQGADYTVDLRPDKAGVVAPSAVPLRGLPGVQVKVKPGTRVLLGFEGGDAARPYAALFEATGLMELEIKADVKVTITAPQVAVNGTAAVVLAGSSVPVARLGDSVNVVGTAGPYPFVGTAVIAAGSPKVFG